MDRTEFTLEEATDFFSIYYGGEHHFPSKIKECGYGWEINDNHGGLATFDFNQLTRLVVMAHDKCIRVGIVPVNYMYLKITLHKRTRGESMTSSHPTLEDHIKFIRDRMPSNNEINL